MSRIPARYSRWSTAQSYFYDTERIIKELKTAVSFVSNPPDDLYLNSFQTNQEDFIMYHQGYFLDLVHQMKDKTCQIIKAIVTYDDKYSRRQENEMTLNKLLKNKNVLKIKGLYDVIREWDDEHNGKIAICLKKRTQYHHYKNTISSADSYLQTKSSRFLLSPSFQVYLSDYGKQMIEDRGKKNFQLWQQETSIKMSDTLEAIINNFQEISKIIVKYYKLPSNEKNSKGIRYLMYYPKLDEKVIVKQNTCREALMISEFRPIANFLKTELKKVLGDELMAVYILGSVVRGDFIFGLSDINLVIILKNNYKPLKDLVKGFINKPPSELNIPIDTKVLSEEEFKKLEKLRFICKTNGVLIYGEDLVKNDELMNISFNLAWMLNRDFKDYIAGIKSLVQNSELNLSSSQLSFLARELGKRSFRLSFSQVIGNNTLYSSNYKKMLELLNFYYPKNKAFNKRAYLLVTRKIMIDREALLSIVNTFEEKLLPLYEAIDGVVNGVNVK